MILSNRMAAAILAASIGASTLAVIADAQRAVEPHAACFEDQTCWDCRRDGDRVCGPGNDQLVEPGCYSDTGALVAGWPCHVDPATGDVYTGYHDPVLPPAMGGPVSTDMRGWDQ